MDVLSPAFQDMAIANTTARHAAASPRPSSSASVGSPSRAPTTLPTNSQIEAAIQKAQAMSPARSSDGRSSSLGRDTRTQLFVGNLPYRVRWQDLKDLFRKAGTILRADVSLGPDNRSRGYGTVLFGNPDDAQRAMELFNGYSWQSRVLEVRPDRLPPDFDMQQLGALPQGANGFTVMPSALHAVPSPLNAMPLPFIPPPPPPGTTLPLASGAPKLEGFEDPLPAPSPMGMFFAGVQAQDRSRASSASGRTLFVGNLPFHCQWQDLKDLFRQAGSVLRADVVLGPDGRSRGHGTVSFSNDADAENALKLFNGYEYNGRPLKVHHDKYTGQTTPMTSASPAPGPPMGGMPFMYSAIPPYLAHAGHSMMMGMPGSQPQSPFESRSIASPASPPQPSRLQSGLTVDSLAATSSTSPRSPRSPRNLHIEINKEKERELLARESGSSSKHHAHPGPITLPPQGPVFPAGVLMSPQSSAAAAAPITPSMPSFTFAPQAQPTPPLHAHFLSPGIGPFSPTLSPGGFFAGPLAHPTPGAAPGGAPLNAAPGAPVRYAPGGMMSHPHSPVTAVPPGSPGFYVPAAYFAAPGPGSPGAMPMPATVESYFPPVHMQPVAPPRHSHPLAQEHTPPTSDGAGQTPSAYGPAYYQFTPVPPPAADADRSKDASPASVFSVSESPLVEHSSPGTSVTPSEADAQQSGGKRPATGERSSSDSTTQTDSTYAGMARSSSTGNHSSMASRTAFAHTLELRRGGGGGGAAQLKTPFEEGDDEGDGQPVGQRDRRASWHVESPSFEGPRGAGVGYFALALPLGPSGR